MKKQIIPLHYNTDFIFTKQQKESSCTVSLLTVEQTSSNTMYVPHHKKQSENNST
jgi:hypothetical protein